MELGVSQQTLARWRVWWAEAFAESTFWKAACGLLHLHRQLGADRWLVAVPAALLVCVVAFAGARAVLGPLAATVPGGRGARIAGTAIAVVLAGGLQLGLAVGEVKLRRDTTPRRCGPSANVRSLASSHSGRPNRRGKARSRVRRRAHGWSATSASATARFRSRSCSPC